MHLVFASKQRLAPEQLGKDAASRPHIDQGRVDTRIVDDLWGAIPAGRHILGKAVLVSVDRVGTRKPKVHDLDRAVSIEHHVRGLHVAVDDSRRVDKRKAAHNLIHEVLMVLHGQLLPALDDEMQISVE
eukprot:Amastigsp_a676228_324.p4 type:complete len:129 gc:universal Amastigsp_a676228_324:750-364(-)